MELVHFYGGLALFLLLKFIEYFENQLTLTKILKATQKFK